MLAAPAKEVARTARSTTKKKKRMFQGARRYAHFWLRNEVKPREFRAALTPSDAGCLVAAGHVITVEESPGRCFPLAEYTERGCKVSAQDSWPRAPASAYILGLKELPDAPHALTHRHIFFAHCYKQQAGWREVLGRFDAGGGTLFDLEFLTDDGGVRVAAFSYMAGVAGAAVSLQHWLAIAADPSAKAGLLEPWPSVENAARTLAAGVVDRSGPRRGVQACIVGANGRSGRGCADFLRMVNQHLSLDDRVAIALWGRPETASPPLWGLLDYDIVLNCVYVRGSMGLFLTQDMLAQARRLTVLGDVSCDVSSPHNPFPFSDRATTMFEPVHRVANHPPLDVMAIDHLPSLLPRDASTYFSTRLTPHLGAVGRTPVWERAKALFRTRMEESRR
jgi:saccharopine dehydrogenase (NAD+, L-lysine-forming)